MDIVTIPTITQIFIDKHYTENTFSVCVFCFFETIFFKDLNETNINVHTIIFHFLCWNNVV